MEFKKTIIIALIVFLFLFLFGCPGNIPVCGNQLCETGEDNPASNYYCLSDCGGVAFHYECQDASCVKINGTGTNQCQIDKDCGVQPKTCSTLGGNTCTQNQDCNGSWIFDASDTNSCCTGNCVDKGVLKKCSEQNGTECSFYVNKKCEGTWLFATDTSFCCSADCYADCSQSEGGSGSNNIQGLNESENSLVYFVNQSPNGETKIKKTLKHGEPAFLAKGETEPKTLTEIKNSYKTIDASGDIYIVELSADPILDYLSSNSVYRQFETQLKANGYSTLTNQIKVLVSSQKTILNNQATFVMSQVNAKYPLAKKASSYYWVFNGFSVKLSNASAVAEVKKIPGVKNVYLSGIAKTTMNDVIPLLSLESVWQMPAPVNGNITGKGIKVGVVDTGVDYTHSDFGSCTTEEFISGSCEKIAGGYDFVNHDNDPMDDMGHGTHVAGIIAANGTAGGKPFKGIAPEAKIYALKVLDSSGSGYYDTIISAIDWAIDPNNDNDNSDHLDVINLSLGGGGTPDDPLSRAIDNAADSGVIPVIAAGNSYGYNTVGTPGNARNAITVGATFNKNYLGDYWGRTDPVVDEVTPFSSKGPVIWGNNILFKPDIVAPGALICSSRYDSLFPEGSNQYYRPCIDEEHVLLAGTSMATPVVAGIAALVKQANPQMDTNEIKSLIVSTGTEAFVDSGSNSFDGKEFATGAGRVSPLDALEAKIIINPTSISLGLRKKFDTYANSSFVITNNSSQQINVTFSDRENNSNFDLNSVCLSSNQSKIIDFNVHLKENYGVYSGSIIIETSDSCASKVNSKTYTLPYTYMKARVLNLTIKLKKDNPDQNQGFVIAAVYSENPRFYESTGFVNVVNLVDGYDFNTSILILNDGNFADVFVTQLFMDAQNTQSSMTENHYAKGIVLNTDSTNIIVDMHNTIKLNNNLLELFSNELNTTQITYVDSLITSFFGDDTSVCVDNLSRINFYAKSENINFPFNNLAQQVFELKGKERTLQVAKEIAVIKYDYPYSYFGEKINFDYSKLKASQINIQQVLTNNVGKIANLGLSIVPTNWTSFWAVLPAINIPRSITLRMPVDENNINNVQYLEWPYDTPQFLQTSYFNGTNYYNRAGANPDFNILQLPIHPMFFSNYSDEITLFTLESSSNNQPHFVDETTGNIIITKPDGTKVSTNYSVSGVHIWCNEDSYPAGLTDCQSGEYIFDINYGNAIIGAEGLTKRMVADYNAEMQIWIIPGEYRKPFCGYNSVIGGLSAGGGEAGSIQYDLDLMNAMLSGEVPLPDNICCVDADNDKQFTQNDVNLVSNYVYRVDPIGNIGKLCSEIN